MFDIIQKENQVIALIGRFDASQSEKAKSIFEEINVSTTLDFNDLEYISSAGLSILLITQKRLKDHNHEISIKNMNRHIREIFQYAGFDQIIRIEE
jgi:anti-sigma B factor antagonist